MTQKNMRVAGLMIHQSARAADAVIVALNYLVGPKTLFALFVVRKHMPRNRQHSVSGKNMDLSVVTKTFQENDGSLPDINLDFGDKPVAADVYALIQARATHLVSTKSYY